MKIKDPYIEQLESSIKERKEYLKLIITPITLAEFMHDTYEEEAKSIGWKTQKSCQVKFKDLPLENKQVMINVADKIIRKLQDFGKGFDDFSHSYVISDEYLKNLDEVAPR